MTEGFRRYDDDLCRLVSFLAMPFVELCSPWASAAMLHATGWMLTHDERRHQLTDVRSAGKRYEYLITVRKSTICSRRAEPGQSTSMDTHDGDHWLVLHALHP